MSRIGKLPIVLPNGVKASISGQSISVDGPLGNLSLTYSRLIKIEQSDDYLRVKMASNHPEAPGRYGLTRTLLANMVKGVTDGFERRLEITGVGYRAEVNGRSVTLHIGYSHPVFYQLPDRIDVKVEANTIIVSGIDKQLVGQVAAELRAVRKPEPYKGKGIAFQDEQIRRKAGKTASK